MGADLNGHIGVIRSAYENVHEGFGYGTRNTKEESI